MYSLSLIGDRDVRVMMSQVKASAEPSDENILTDGFVRADFSGDRLVEEYFRVMSDGEL